MQSQQIFVESWGPEYMPIVPVGMFDVLEKSKANSVFILPQFWGNREYKEFYQTHQWKNVIIDNALYENTKAVPFKDLLEMARTLSAQRIFVVGPEKLTDGIETAYMTLDILDEYKTQGAFDGPHGNNIQLMQILHQVPNEMRTQYNMTKQFKDLAYGISIFSFRLGYDRSTLYKYVGLDSNPYHPYVHAFGWDNILESYNMAGRFMSVDSSIAVTAAVNKIDLKDLYQICRQPGRAGAIDTNTPRCHTLDPASKFSDAIKYKVLENINFLVEITRNGGPTCP